MKIDEELLAQEIKQLRAELAACKRDAERYRYIRDDGDGFEITVREVNEDGGETWVAGYPPTELDAAIDAARLEGKMAELPPLPEPLPEMFPLTAYTPQQMRDYGRQCVEAYKKSLRPMAYMNDDPPYPILSLVPWTDRNNVMLYRLDEQQT